VQHEKQCATLPAWCPPPAVPAGHVQCQGRLCVVHERGGAQRLLHRWAEARWMVQHLSCCLPGLRRVHMMGACWDTTAFPHRLLSSHELPRLTLKPSACACPCLDSALQRRKPSACQPLSSAASSPAWRRSSEAVSGTALPMPLAWPAIKRHSVMATSLAITLAYMAPVLWQVLCFLLCCSQECIYAWHT